MESLKLFLSASTDELGVYREGLAKVLIGSHLEVKEQKDFLNLGTDTLTKLDEYIKHCKAVVHLIGEGAGSCPKEINVRDVARGKDFAAKCPFLPDVIPHGHLWTYTQWEAYLALYYGIPLLQFQVADDAERGPKYVPTAEAKASQDKHRALLRSIGRHSKTFHDSHELNVSVLQELLSLRLGAYLSSAAKSLVIPSNLPTVGSLFKGRDEFLAQLRAVLKDKPIAAVTAKHAIHGLGGVGKTRAAIEYGMQHEEHYNALLFITIDSPDKFESEIANLCGVLKLAEVNQTEQKVQYQAALAWLQANPGWFLIIDNVDTPEAAAKVEKELSQLRGGHVVITSRLANWSTAVVALELNVISDLAAQEMILELTAGKRAITLTDESEALALAHDLGCLPLALEQAGAYIAEDHCSLAAYRALWKQHDDEVLNWHNDQLMKYPRPVATTWQTSFDRVGSDGQHLLNILCWLAPDPIPVGMLDKITNKEGEVEINVKTARRNLAKYSLIKWVDAEHTSLKVHRLVQEITEYRLAGDACEGWLRRALRMLDEFCDVDPEDFRTWAQVYTPARPHFSMIVVYANNAKITEPTTRLMNNVGMYCQNRAEYPEAERLMKDALAIDETSFGKEHPTVAGHLSNVAALYYETNRLDEAEPLILRALAIDEASFGKDHPTVATRLNNLAGLYLATNRLDEAEPLILRALAIDEASYGKVHSRVAIDLNNLAQVYQATNRLAQAEPLMLRALAIDEQSFGKEHPNVARDLNNLAGLYQATNRLAQAEPLMLQALAIDETSFGKEHPNVARDLNNLAQLYRAANRLAEAEPCYVRGVKPLWNISQTMGHPHPNLQAGIANYLGFLTKRRLLRKAEALARIRAELTAAD